MKRRHFLLATALGAVLAAGCSKTTSDAAPKELTVDEVAARIAAHDGKTFIYDNNDKDRWTKSHVPGAKWVAFDKVTAADLPPNKEATLVFYCAHEL